MVVKFPVCPESLKAVQPYLKLAAEHDEKDPVISYWCRLFSLQTALTIDKKSNEAKTLLLALMDWLEKTKRAPDASESITSEVAAQAYVENYALKLFVWADNMDRAGTYNKNVVKSFYASGLVLDIMTVFGELNEDLANNRKYAKWKAAYIHKCLSNGETPVSGPMNTESGQENSLTDEERELNELLNFSKPFTSQPSKPSNSTNNVSDIPSSTSVPSHLPVQPDNGVLYNPHPTPASETPQPIHETSSGVHIGAAEITKAQKYCKFASSALNYDDVPEAIKNLQKALDILQTGHDN